MSDVVYKRHSRDDLFSRTECEEILKNILGDGVKGELLEFKIEPELGSVGFMGEYFHLHLKYRLDNATPAEQRTRVFVKTMPYLNADLSYFIEKSGILKKETTLYGSLLNELRKLSSVTWCAQCFYVREDLFVMQNILDLGYEPLADPSVFLDEQHIRSMLKGLAVMHASSIAYEDREQLSIGEKLKDVLYEVTVSPTVDWYTTGLRAVLAVAEKHPLYQSEEHQSFIRHQLPQYFETVYDMVNPSPKYRNVFCHRDSWGGNVFFSKSHPEEAAVFVDFQLCRYSPAAIDVLMVLYLNMTPKDRKRLMEKSCRFYYEAFTGALSKMGLKADDHMTWSDFENSLKDFEFFGALYNAMTVTILRVPDDYLTKMKQTRPDDFYRYANVDRTEEVLQFMESNPEFKEYMNECVEDMMETGLRQKSI